MPGAARRARARGAPDDRRPAARAAGGHRLAGGRRRPRPARGGHRARRPGGGARQRSCRSARRPSRARCAVAWRRPTSPPRWWSAPSPPRALPIVGGVSARDPRSSSATCSAVGWSPAVTAVFAAVHLRGGAGRHPHHQGPDRAAAGQGAGADAWSPPSPRPRSSPTPSARSRLASAPVLDRRSRAWFDRSDLGSGGTRPMTTSRAPPWTARRCASGTGRSATSGCAPTVPTSTSR